MKKYVRRLESVCQKKKIYLRSDISLQKLAKMLGTNRTYLSIIFHEVYNTTYYGFINSKRVVVAAQLLREKNVTVRDAMIACGFSSYNSFRDAFREVYGCRPGEYLRKAKAGLIIAEEEPPMEETTDSF